MKIEEKIKTNLLNRGFSEKNLLNNRGLIGATIDETIIQVTSREKTMSKEYKITTIQDMINCTNEENLDRFLIDLKNQITTVHALRSMGELESESFIWIDDGKNDGEIKIVPNGN